MKTFASQLFRLLHRSHHGARACCATLALLSAFGCAEAVPQGRYGIDSVEIKGAEHVDDQALLACLATRERERFGFTLGAGQAPQCGVPPFDRSHTPVGLWTWPWTEWPLLNDSAFDRDLDRVERWYVARGYYDARVVLPMTRVEKNADERTAQVQITVDEGEPALIFSLSIRGIDALDPSLQQALRDAVLLTLGEPFDEALHDETKAALAGVLFDASYARAAVTASAQVDVEKKLVRVEYTLVPGPPCTFGTITVTGNGELSSRVIREAAAITPGARFSLEAVRDAQRAIYALGPFASVDIERDLRGEQAIVDLIVHVVPGREVRFGFGIGMESGGIYSQEASQEADQGTGDSFAQWDAHLLGRVEHRNFLGGMRRLRVEERPRLIFDDPFPSVSRSGVGNLLTVELRQPAFIEPRTTLVARVKWDRGPDPYGGRFLRHDLVASLGPERDFLSGALRISSTINTDLFLPDSQDPYPNTELAYFFHLARIDLRDDPRNPRSGSYFTLGVQHAGYILPSDWDYVRITQDSRGYIALPFGLVLAGRARIGWMAITDSTISVPSEANAAPGTQAAVDAHFLQNLADLGPLRHRLRGGGHNSVRGYAPNTLGDVERINGRLISGGLRQWETSVELRIPITESFGAATFWDMGDVSRGTSYRFNYPQMSFGLGLRYRTIVGPLRFDAALAPSALQVFGHDDRIRTGVATSRVFGIADGAVHFTIGEAF